MFRELLHEKTLVNTCLLANVDDDDDILMIDITYHNSVIS